MEVSAVILYLLVADHAEIIRAVVGRFRQAVDRLSRTKEGSKAQSAGSRETTGIPWNAKIACVRGTHISPALNPWYDAEILTV